MKTATILKANLTGEWTNPAGKTVYYHELTLDNGEVGNIGVMERYPNKISTGTIIQYTMDEKRKIKIINDTNNPLNMSSQSNNKPSANQAFTKKTYSNAQKSPVDFLGFTWGYAKDLVIAGKTMDDVEELNKMARYIYEQITQMLHDKGE